jgi:hypothetical protein
MHQMQVYIYDAGLLWLVMHHVGIPDFLEHGFGRHIGSLP